MTDNGTSYDARLAKAFVGDLRVWHIPQIPGATFYVNVSNMDEAHMVRDVLSDYDLFQYANKIKPDYANANGIERYEAEDPFTDEPVYGWFEVDEEEYE